ncbi:MAG: UDP-N-acetylmuramoylalanine--D-glutamate ligase, partial [Pseudomonadota bacterium]
LNISPDHMDRYASLDAYAAAKARVFAGDAIQVLNRDDPRVAAMALPDHAQRWFSVAEPQPGDYHLARQDGEPWLMSPEGPFMPVAALQLQGRHNQANALAALALGDAAGLDPGAMRAVLAGFTGLDHRMQWVAQVDGVDYINDSKATNIGACEAALQGLEVPVVLIAGGDGKGADFSELAAAVRHRVRALVLVGRDAPLLEAALGALVPCVHAGSMQDAVGRARACAQPGDTVLLAPACASLDQYRDYQQRGELFAAAVRALCA